MIPKFEYDRVASTSYNDKGLNTIISPASGGQLAIGQYVLSNRSGGSIDVGFGYRESDDMWQAGTITAASTPDYVSATAAAQSGTTDAFRLFTTTNSDGFLVASVKPFNQVHITISTASGSGGVFAYTYYNGSSMASLTTLETATFTSTGNTSFSFLAPNDWVPGTTAAVGGPSSLYCVQVVASTHPTTTGGSASRLRVNVLTDFFPQLGNNLEVSEDYPDGELVIPAGQGPIAYFGGSASANNNVKLAFRKLGA